MWVQISSQHHNVLQSRHYKSPVNHNKIHHNCITYSLFILYQYLFVHAFVRVTQGFRHNLTNFYCFVITFLQFSLRYFEILEVACSCLVALVHISLIWLEKFKSMSMKMPKTFTFVSIGISMLETLKLVGNGVDPCGTIIPWNLDGLASISFRVYQFTAMAAHCSRRNFNLSMFLSE